MRVLVADHISEEGISVLRNCAEVDIKVGLKPEELISIIGDYDALMVRSQTQVTDKVIEAGTRLQVIGRAGTGTDNINVEAATRHGIIVVNAPAGNTISATEHTIALMLALARHIAEANRSLKSGAWKRNDFMGTELKGKTLGIVGLGRIGSEIAKRARAFEMRLLGHDPFISVDHAARMQVELVSLEQLLKESDFVTLHVPLTSTTKTIIGPKELALMKPTARIINCARGGLIDDEALANALKGKKLAGAAIDVFVTEPTTKSPLFEFGNVVVTPHLGASTNEAQLVSARDVAEQIVDVFNGQPPRYAVNAPFIPSESLTVLMPFIKLATTVGKLASQLADGQVNSIQVKYCGEIAAYDTNAIKAAVLGGLLEGISEERVNLVNANVIASQRGLSVIEQKEATCENYASLITLVVTTSAGATEVAGTVMRGESHIVKINQFWVDLVPTGGYLLFSDHRDRPGLIGAVGNITGGADVNISYMHVSRLKARGRALMILELDEALPEEFRQQILRIPDVYSVKVVKL